MLTFGSAMRQIAPGPKKEPEDTCFSIANLVVASSAKELDEFYQWCARRQEIEFLHSQTHSPMYPRKAFNPFTAEFLAQAILRRLGVRTVPAQILSFAEARKLPDNFVVKFAEVKEPELVLHARFPFRLQRVVSTAYCLASEVLENAATFDFIARKFGITPGWDRPYPGMARVAALSSEKLTAGLTSIILRKECPAADALYANFSPTPEELKKIGAAMRWSGRDFLKICAARAFVACSAPHNANVLVTPQGELISIDHCTIHREDGDDLRMLFRYINRNSSVFGVLSDIAALAETEIRAAVAEIPCHPACRCDYSDLTIYFVDRLRLWKNLCAAEATVDSSTEHAAVV